MGMKSIPVSLPGGITVKLRLTLGGQKAMKALNPDGSILENILNAMDDPEAMEALLTECLNWKGNDNPIHDGEELYNLLVDGGKAGMADFGELILDICRGAGILKQEDCERVNRIIAKASRKQSETLEEAAAAEEPAPMEESTDPLAPEDPLMVTLDG